MPISKRPSKAVVNQQLQQHLQEQAARNRIYNARILGRVLDFVVETEYCNCNFDLETLVDLMNSDGSDEVAVNSVGQAMLDARLIVMKKRV
jgi:predicted nucleic acid-binding Zn finger protein